jgi:CRP/FNR family cyclic AMP-dependent transcriptional regulator
VTAPPIPQDPFSPLEEATLRAIAETGVVRTFPKNTVLIHEGDSGDALYIVLSGRVKVYASNAQGREFAIAFHGAGEYVGEMTLDGGVRSASVVTIDPTVCAVVHREQFREFILKNPDFALHLIEKLINRVRATTEDVKSLALTDVYGRLVRLINTLAVPGADGTSMVPEKLTQQAIA